MEEEVVEKEKEVAAAVDADNFVGPNEVVARASDGTRFYLYNHQAGGHTAFLRSGEGSVCKPVVALELEFYEALAPRFPQLRPFVPQFLGKIKVELTTTTSNEPPTSSHSSSTPPIEALTTPKKIRRGSFGKKRRLGKYSPSSSIAPPLSEGGYSAQLWKQERAEKNKTKTNGVTLTRAASAKDYLVLGDLTRNFRRPC
ncbi:Inositol hexakisphosphate kinase, partial [Phytophthora palmivora]